jgi:hypothetical protein
MAVGVLVALGLAGALAFAGPGAGPANTVICHYSYLTGQWNTLTLGTAAAGMHLSSHSKDYMGACTQSGTVAR